MLCLQLINRYSSGWEEEEAHSVSIGWGGETIDGVAEPIVIVGTSRAGHTIDEPAVNFSSLMRFLLGQYFLIGKKQQLDYHSKLMARSRRLSTWCIARCFSCCFNLLATDSGSSPCDSNDSEYSGRTSFNSSSTSLTKSILKSISSASKVGLRGPWC